MILVFICCLKVIVLKNYTEPVVQALYGIAMILDLVTLRFFAVLYAENDES